MRRKTRAFSRVVTATAPLFLLAGACAGWAIACGADDAAPVSGASDAGLPDNRVEPLDGGGQDGASPDAPVSCDTYCDLVEDACTDAHDQYTSRAECLGFCAAIPLGERGDRTTNTVACRAYHAGIPAKTEPQVHCGSAGPFGDGVCGDRCTTFCQLAFALCDGDGGAPPFASVPECVTECTGYPYGVEEPDGGPDAGDGGRDTLNCRIALLREARVDASLCAELGSPSGVCR